MGGVSSDEVHHTSKTNHQRRGIKNNILVHPLSHILPFQSHPACPNTPSPQSSTASAPEPRHYARPSGSELVSSKQPSCSGLPETWTYIHDRFIAYLATHAPLEKNGKIPRHEERRERWRTEDIARLVMERFPELGCHVSVFIVVLAE